MKKLNKEEFLEIYGEAKVVFSHYYKYSFTFEGEFNGNKIYVSVGESADGIYKFNVEAGKEYTVNKLRINYAEVKDGETIIAELVD